MAAFAGDFYRRLPALNDTEKTVEARASVLRDVLIRVQDNLELEHGEEASQEVEMSPPKKVPRESSSKCGGTSSKKTTLSLSRG